MRGIFSSPFDNNHSTLKNDRLTSKFYNTRKNGVKKGEKKVHFRLLNKGEELLVLPSFMVKIAHCISVYLYFKKTC